MNLSRAIAVIGGWTMVSRLTGLLREILIARYLGAGMAADAFFVAFRFPNLFRSLFAEGAFNAAFVPAFARKMEGEGRAEAKLFAERCLSLMFWFLLLFVALMEICMPWAMVALAPGFDEIPGKMELAVELSRISFPYLLFISMVALQSGALNAMGRFAAAAGTPVLLNVITVAFLIGLTPYVETGAHALCWGVAAAGAAQFLWLTWSLRRADFALFPRVPKLTPDLVAMLGKIVPGAVGAGAYQINLAINTMIASLVANGAVSHLNYAERVNQLPLGVVGVAIGTALLPMLARQLRSGDEQAALYSQNRAIELGLLLVLPAATALATIAYPTISVLFQRGSFTSEDSLTVSMILRILVAGLPAYVLIKALAPGFFARGDTSTPMRIAVFCMILNVALNLLLMGPLGVYGMAVSTAASAWVNVALLALFLTRRGFFALDRRLRDRSLRIALACGLMAGALWGGVTVMEPWFEIEGGRIGALTILILGGATLYGALILLLKAANFSEFRAMMKREAGKS